jgi:hypothetical protein
LQNPYETAAPLLSFDHADKYYTNAGERVRALDDVSLEVGSRIDSILDGLVLGKKNLSILAKKAGQGEICPPPQAGLVNPTSARTIPLPGR